MGAWPLEWPLAGIVATGILYALGGRRAAHPSLRRTASFYGGLLALLLAADSPIAAHDDTLFWAHMTQHVLLTMVAPPLLLLGRPWPQLTRALPRGARRPLARMMLVTPALAPARRAFAAIGAPAAAFALFNGVLLAWHLPPLYDLTLRNALVHDAEHALFFGAALLFWVHLAPAGPRRRLTDLQRAIYGTGAILVGWSLALVLALAPHPLYAYSDLTTRPGGLSALADQHIAAGIMWVPASVPFTIAVFAAAYRFLEPVRDLRPRET